mgnify:FL=1|tara:strand:+ start:2812 stop:3105 length:294 start_codon:yes stop_codon:yes gene_type:complete
MNNSFEIFDIIGYIAGILCAVQNIPQIYKLYQTKSGKDISKVFLYIGIISGILWIIFSIHEKNLPVLLFGICEVILLSIVLMMTYKYSQNENDNNII